MTDRRAIVLFIALGAATHFVRLTVPRQVVFDEVLMGKHVSAYCCTGEHTFDVHPPHGKLLIALGAKLGGYDGTVSFESIGLPYGEAPVFFLRLVPALAGISLAPLFFVLLRRLGASPPAALLGGLAVVFDNALLLETRILVFDGILVAATLASVVFLLGIDVPRSPFPLPRSPFPLPRSPFPLPRSVQSSLLCGAFAGLAIGTKFTGLVTLAIAGIYLAYRIFTDAGSWIRRITTRAAQGLVILASTATIYLAGWVAHFTLLTKPGSGDAFHPTTGGFWHDLVVVHKTMWVLNVGMTDGHPDASPPWTWPLMKVVPYFWAGQDSTIYMLGNPMLWWGASALMFVIVVNWLVLVVSSRWQAAPASALPRYGEANPSTLLWLPLAAWAVAFLPLLRVTRVLFMYHYFTPLLFSAAFVLLWLDASGWIRPSGIRDQRWSYFAAITAIVVLFLLITPVTYGFSLGNYDEWLSGLIRSWR